MLLKGPGVERGACGRSGSERVFMRSLGVGRVRCGKGCL